MRSDPSNSQYYSSNKLILALLWMSNEFGTGRGFSSELIGSFSKVRPAKAEVFLDRMKKRGMVMEDEGLYTLRIQRTKLDRRGLPYETTRKAEEEWNKAHGVEV